MNVFLKVSLEFKNSCVKSNQPLLSFSQDLAYPYHGKSTITRESLIRKKLNNLVFQGILEHLAKSFLCTNILIKEDFQTFERPKNANSGKSRSGHCFISATLFMNSDEIIFIRNTILLKRLNNIK